MSFPASQRLIVVVALTLVGAYQLTRTAHDATSPRLAVARDEPQGPTATLQHRSSEPLRFDPPAAGPSSGNPAYEACIDQPSFDGATIDCQLLLPKPVEHRSR